MSRFGKEMGVEVTGESVSGRIPAGFKVAVVLLSIGMSVYLAVLLFGGA